jgi:hypothetical protein
MLKSLLVYSALFLTLPGFFSLWVFLGKVFNEANNFIQLVCFLVYFVLYINFHKFNVISRLTVSVYYQSIVSED